MAIRLAQAEAAWQAISEKVESSYQQRRDAASKLQDTTLFLSQWQREARELATAYTAQNRQPTPHCQLTRANRKVTVYTNRLPRCQAALAKAERRLARHIAQYDEAEAEVDRLQAHYQQLLADNAVNSNPIRATFRLDAGFASLENIYWLIEMGYDLYTRGRSTKVRDAASAAVTPDTIWERVGGNAAMTAWANTTVEGYFAYPLVQVGAHTSAWVKRQGDVWLLMFTEQSLYAGHSLRFGGGAIQLPLPLFGDIHFSHF